MTKNLIIATFIAGLCGGLSYFASNNLYVAVAITVVFFCYMFFVFLKRLQCFFEHLFVAQSGHSFINQFIIAVSVHTTLPAAFFQIQTNASKHLKAIFERLPTGGAIDHLTGLGNYFNTPLYQLFLDIINIYNDQGGLILTMSEYLLSQVRASQEQLIGYRSLIISKLTELIILWTIAAVITIVMRMSLADMYLMMVKDMTMLVFIAAFFLTILLSLHLFSNLISKLHKELMEHDV